MPATKKPEPIRIAIIEQRPSGDLCRMTIPADGDEVRLAGWIARIKASTVYPVTTKILVPSAA